MMMDKWEGRRLDVYDPETGIRQCFFGDLDLSQLKGGDDCLAARLCKARAAAQAVAKDGRNPHQGYRFAKVDAVAEEATRLAATHLILTIVVPVWRSSERMTFARGTDGNRIMMRYRCAVISASDPEDRFEFACEVENHGTADKGQAACWSFARKACLLEVFQIPRADEHDPDSHEHPGLAPAADIVGRDALRAAIQTEGDKGELSKPRCKRMFAIAKRAGWPVDAYRAECEFLAGAEDRIPWTLYDAVVEHFRAGPPTLESRGSAGPSDAEVWTRLRTAVESARATDAELERVGEQAAARLLQEICLLDGWDDSRFVSLLEAQLGEGAIEDLPRYIAGKDGKALPLTHALLDLAKRISPPPDPDELMGADMVEQS